MKRVFLKWLFVLFLLMSHRAVAEGVVSGFVFEQDGISPIAGATITFSGIGALGDTLYYQFNSDTLGFYEAEIEAGSYWVSTEAEGYSPSVLPDSLQVENNLAYLDINFILNELYLPVSYVEAELFTDDFVCVTWSMFEDTTRINASKSARSLRYFDLFRRRADEPPVMMASHLTDTLFMDMHWNSLPWGQYAWGVSCWYEGNRTASDTVWSNYLDKDMTTIFELVATTNIGLAPAGALVSLVSVDGGLHSYVALLDENGLLELPAVYRDDYVLSVHLDGYEDYVSPDTISVFAPVHVEIELVEMIMPVEGLYVSSTGWAMWQLVEPQTRDLQYFELMLDEETVATTTERSFQLDVDGLEVGSVYVVKVRPVYISGSGDWITWDWTYHSCEAYAGTVNGLGWSLLEESVLLSWDYPDNEDFAGAILYRDGVYLGFTEEQSFLDEGVATHADMEYSISLVYDGEWDGTYYSMSCKECAMVSFPLFCDAPTKLEGDNYWESDSNFGALISWGDRPPLIQEWLHYDNGVYKNVIGNSEEPILFWAIRFDAEDLVDYQGTTLTKVSLFDAGEGTYQLWIYEGGETAPRTLVRYDNMNLEGSYTWHEHLIEPYEIPENELIWIVVGQQGLSRPAAACADMGHPNGRWVSMDGTTWHDMHDYNVHYTWMLRAFVTNHSGKTHSGFTLQRYNLYRSYDNADYQQIASVSAVDGQAFYQYRDVLVGTSNHKFYYRLTAFYLSDEGEECESEYAASLLDPEANYVMVDDHWMVTEQTDNALVVYPNPTSGRLKVEAESIRRVSVYNALGQCLADFHLEADIFHFDLSHWENGLYLLKVVTEKGTLSRRFVVSH